MAIDHEFATSRDLKPLFSIPQRQLDVRCSIYFAAQNMPAKWVVFWVRFAVLICRRGMIVALRVAD
jgi:hypothetical protein